MADPVTFPQANGVRTAPPSMKNCKDLPIHYNEAHGAVISKWKLSGDELMKVLETGCIWISVYGGVSQPPFKVEGFDPFEGKT